MRKHMTNYRGQLHTHMQRMWELRSSMIERRPIEPTQPRTTPPSQRNVRTTAPRQQPSVLDLFQDCTSRRSTNKVSRKRKQYDTNRQTTLEINNKKMKLTTTQTSTSRMAAATCTAPTTATLNKSQQKQTQTNTLLTVWGKLTQNRKQKKRKLTLKHPSTPHVTAKRTIRDTQTTPHSTDTTKTKKIKKNRPKHKLVGIIRATRKQPKKEYIQSMQAWLHGKSVNSVLGIAEYPNSDTGVTSIFRAKDPQYYIKSGYCTLHDDSSETHTATPPKVSALTEENLRTRDNMLEPQPNTTNRPYSPTTVASSVSNCTMSKSETASEKSARLTAHGPGDHIHTGDDTKPLTAQHSRQTHKDYQPKPPPKPPD